VRTTDVVGRYGGDEFVLLLPDTDAEPAKIVAERVVVAVREVGVAHAPARGITASVGMAIATAEDDARALLSRADDAAYAAKSHQGNCVSSEHDIPASA
jgi:diguanylate cyclase (GGDEF)-like protein